MIKKFKSVTGIHGLSDFSWTADDLEKYSLFYGWNGSGKTTLSNILYCLQYKKIAIEDFQNVEYKVEVLSKPTISNKEVSSHSLNLAVFNQSYIDANIHFDNSGTEPITMIGEENIKLLEEIESDQKELDKKSGLLTEKDNEQYCMDILTQSLAIQKSLASLNKLIVENHLTTHITEMLSSGEEKEQTKAIEELLNLYELNNVRSK